MSSNIDFRIRNSNGKVIGINWFMLFKNYLQTPSSVKSKIKSSSSSSVKSKIKSSSSSSVKSKIKSSSSSSIKSKITPRKRKT